MTPETRRLLFGTTEAPEVPVPLRARSLSAELAEGRLQRIAWNGIELVRGISFLIRDKAWGTAPTVLEPVEVTSTAEEFDARWSGRIDAPDACFTFEARLTGSRAGRLTFVVSGRPGQNLTTNRAGFVILHPAHFSGLDVTLFHVDGRTADARFPTTLSPGQPFFDLRAMRVVLPGVGRVTCRMEARLPSDPLGRFETEDQRNWGDASFKTYPGSLLDPWPYVLPAGEDFRQEVAIEVEPDTAVAERSVGSRVATVRAAPNLPRFGIGIPHDARTIMPAESAALRALALDWWIVACDMRMPDIHAHLAAAAALHESCDATPPRVQLEIILPATATPTAELAAVAEACRRAGLVPDAVLACPAPYLKSFQPTDRWPDLPPLEDWYAAARAAFPASAVGGGMVTNFTELNRKRPVARDLAFISHTTTAIVHAADDEAVMETLETLAHIAASVRAYWPGIPYRVGPSSIAMRSNPYGDGIARNTALVRMPLADRDPRHDGLYGAAWTVGYAAAMVDQGAELVALHASHGDHGLMRDGRALPLLHVMTALGRASGRVRVPLAPTPGLAALAWEGPRGREAMIANLRLTAMPLALPMGGTARLLDIQAAPRTDRAGWEPGPPGPIPARLGPYAVAFVAPR